MYVRDFRSFAITKTNLLNNFHISVQRFHSDLLTKNWLISDTFLATLDNLMYKRWLLQKLQAA